MAGWFSLHARLGYRPDVLSGLVVLIADAVIPIVAGLALAGALLVAAYEFFDWGAGDGVGDVGGESGDCDLPEPGVPRLRKAPKEGELLGRRPRIQRFLKRVLIPVCSVMVASFAVGFAFKGAFYVLLVSLAIGLIALIVAVVWTFLDAIGAVDASDRGRAGAGSDAGSS